MRKINVYVEKVRAKKGVPNSYKLFEKKLSNLVDSFAKFEGKKLYDTFDGDLLSENMIKYEILLENDEHFQNVLYLIHNLKTDLKIEIISVETYESILIQV